MKNKKILVSLCLIFGFFQMGQVSAAEPVTPFSFGVISQRSPLLSAQFWNPILRYVSDRSGVPLELSWPRRVLNMLHW